MLKTDSDRLSESLNGLEYQICFKLISALKYFKLNNIILNLKLDNIILDIEQPEVDVKIVSLGTGSRTGSEAVAVSSFGWIIFELIMKKEEMEIEDLKFLINYESSDSVLK